MFEVLVIENSPGFRNDMAPLATWTEVFATYEEALAYKEMMIFQEPLSYHRECFTTLITNVHVEKRAPLLEVQP